VFDGEEAFGDLLQAVSEQETINKRAGTVLMQGIVTVRDKCASLESPVGRI